MTQAVAKVTKLPVRARNRQQWAEAIGKSWKLAIDAAQSAVKAGVTTGHFLIKAKEDLAHGDFMDMVKEDLPFSQAKANDLMRIAAHPSIGNSRQGVNSLPEGWTILRKLADLTEEDFKWATEHGLISKDMTRGSAIAIKRARQTDAKVIEISKGERGPTPKEARKIARETGRIIVGSDGRMYTGTTEDEDAAYNKRLNTVYGVKEAIEAIANVSAAPKAWVKQSEDHWIFDFDVRKIDAAVGWLTELKPLLAQRVKEVKARHAQ